MGLYFSVVAPIVAALIDLNTPGSYISFGVISISVANFVVVLIMTALFLGALFLPFPKKKERLK